MKAFKSYLTPAAQPASESQQAPMPPLETNPQFLSPRAAESKIRGRRPHHSAADPSNADLRAVSLSPSRAVNSPARAQSPASTKELTPEKTPVGSPQKSSAPSTRPNSARNSRVSGIFPLADGSETSLLDIKSDMMVKWMYEQQLRKQYTSGANPAEGVVLKKCRGSFTCCPPDLQSAPDGLYAMVTQMNVKCAMTVNTPVVRAIMSSLKTQEQGIDFVPLADGLRVQILQTIEDLPKGQLHHFAAFIEDAGVLVVWDDDPEGLFRRGEELESRIVAIIWGDVRSQGAETLDEKNQVQQGGEDIDPRALEEALANEQRPVRLESASLVACSLCVALCCLGLGWRNLALEVASDGSYGRLGLLLVAPIQFFVSLFFFQVLVGNLFQMFGPISAVSANSKYYSGKAPRRLRRSRDGLPHVTIQIPVYKEGLNGVIRPTVMSLKAAISTYEMQGGTANIFVNDDGMQLLSEDEAQTRRDFYDEHNIGWVARPKHNPNPVNGEKAFLRRGKFKKASNMNYALHVSNRIEDKLQQVRRSPNWGQGDEDSAYCDCLADVLREDAGRTWAEGNIRVGDYILLIDSDTRVPDDCLLDAVSEMGLSPNVAILQHSSGVMRVTDSYFEKGVTWFTNLIYTAITYAVASGDACPFVGHNAVLRWQAIQDAAAYTDEDGYEKFWSESHVSEDFDMSLRLQVAGYALRYASYTGDGFKEGVSLTVYDELARWEKYAYGCNELLFHPLRFWFSRGPITKLFSDFMLSSIHLPKKLTICAYIGTYYAIASAALLSVANYFLTGWFRDVLDTFYLDSFAIYISIILVFTGLGNLALAVLRYRLGERSFLGSLLENIKWIPMFTIFLGGISIHLSQAILSHFLEIDMAWGATAKEMEDVNFGEEIGRIMKKFKWTFAFCFLCTALMLCGWFLFPVQWRIQTFFSVYPLATVVVGHFALPVLLNPALMMFTW